jgi:hypothetical protein
MSCGACRVWGHNGGAQTEAPGTNRSSVWASAPGLAAAWVGTLLRLNDGRLYWGTPLILVFSLAYGSLLR